MDHQTKETALEIGGWYDLPNNFTGVVKYFDDYRWYVYGLIHREDGPAIEHSNGSKKWLINGKFHREDGPAIIWSGGSKSWYLSNAKYTQEAWFEELTPEQKEKAIWNMDNW